ncbi:metallophosphoesterase [Mycobacterium sp. AZCC_0083]|uniref:metallophosphoesterase n=1 Tax=Mycobacterium sp. AZCC_0083 TaxID=2735882 RepID=UPI00161230C0|nr:metallophosphoesterase [Mycobacterium sp. AZCC_0083]MBB5167109.1 calcineurin-like phosphoesterase family protein [Mycobacterium sp. AZCC_0083]
MSNVWFTSDLHIGHRKVAASRIQFDGKPAFEDLDNLPEWFGAADIAAHDRILAENWDAVVGDEDDVWILGDNSSGTSQAQFRALEWLRQRPGRKRLIPGNHCGPHPMHRDAHKWMKVYEESGVFVSAPQLAARRRIPLAVGHVTALLSHFPYVGDREGVDRHKQWRLPDCGDWILHGHTHSDRVLQPGLHSRQLHVGVDAWGGMPVALEEIIRIIKDQESLGI